jgi:tetratricopeptide (TPR) repeat protein
MSRRIIAAGLLGILVVLPVRAAEPTEFPAEARDRYTQGEDLRKKQQFRDAIAAFEQAIKLGMKNYPRVHLRRADAFRELQEYEAAITQYTEFIAKFGIEESCRY